MMYVNYISIKGNKERPKKRKLQVQHGVIFPGQVAKPGFNTKPNCIFSFPRNVVSQAFSVQYQEDKLCFIQIRDNQVSFLSAFSRALSGSWQKSAASIRERQHTASPPPQFLWMRAPTGKGWGELLKERIT